MNKFIFSDKIKIIVILLFALLLVKGMNGFIFLTNTPKINPLFIARLKSPSKWITPTNPVIAFLSQIFKQKDYFSDIVSINPPKDISFIPISKGVYAAEDKKSKTVYYKLEKGAKMEVRIYTVKLKNGQDKIIKIVIPLN